MPKRTHQPWVEKYRPRYVKDVVHHENLKQVLSGAQKTGDLPHLLFHGPPGTGKTSTILALARTLFGDCVSKERVLELNASDERGLDVVRDKIKTFSRVSVSLHQKSIPPIKLVILDEADTMTPDAQSALRRTMETHAAVTRFCLVCNYASKIIAPLASRCAKFRFSPLSPTSMNRRLVHICEKEGAIFQNKCSRRVLDAIVASSKGDMRNAINTLQTVSQLPSVTEDTVTEISGEVPERVLNELWHSMTTRSAQNFESVVRAALSFVGQGYSVGKVLAEVQGKVVSAEEEISDTDKATICTKLLEVDRCLNDGADEELQLLDLCCAVQDVFLN